MLTKILNRYSIRTENFTGSHNLKTETKEIDQ